MMCRMCLCKNTHTPCWKIPQRWFSQRTKPPLTSMASAGIFHLWPREDPRTADKWSASSTFLWRSAEGCEPWMLDPWSLTIKPAGAIPFSILPQYATSVGFLNQGIGCYVMCYTHLLTAPTGSKPGDLSKPSTPRHSRYSGQTSIKQETVKSEWSLNLYTYVYIYIYLFIYYSWFIDIYRF